MEICRKKWWTIADITPKINSEYFCPHCKNQGIIEKIETFEIEEPEGDNA